MGIAESFPSEIPMRYKELYDLFQNHYFSENDIEDNMDSISWIALLELYPLSLKFLIRHQDNINWNALSSNKYLNDEIIQYFEGNIQLEYAIPNRVLSQKYATELLLDEYVDWEHRLDLLEFYKFSEYDLRTIVAPQHVFNIRHPSFNSVYDWIVRYQDLSESYLFDMDNLLKSNLVDQYQPLAIAKY